MLDLLDLVHLIILVFQVKSVLLLLLDANLSLHQVVINILFHSISSLKYTKNVLSQIYLLGKYLDEIGVVQIYILVVLMDNHL